MVFPFFSAGDISANVDLQTNSLEDSSPSDSYNGLIKIYIVEPVSRWNDYDGDPYEFGFIDFALEKELDIPYQETYEMGDTWDGHTQDITIYEDNIMGIAVVFNGAAEQGYSDPPGNQHPFDAYYVDATAAAFPGETGYNTITDEFTHTVFMEEGTGTWCGNCPILKMHLHNIYESHDYPFYYAALVEDECAVGRMRLIDDYNIFGYPTLFGDGGYQVVMGGFEDEARYRDAIEACGSRDVHNLNLSLTLEWLGESKIRLEVSVMNNELASNRPPREPQRPTGPKFGFVYREYIYSAVTTDADDHDIEYMFDWGDGTFSEWYGPYPSGEAVEVSHNWSDKGEYQIRVKARDIIGDESEWSEPLSVVMPRHNSMGWFDRVFHRQKTLTFRIWRMLFADR